MVSPPIYVTSSACHGAGNCVEVGVSDGQVLVRDSKNPEQAPLRFTAGEWDAFVAGVRNGEFMLAALGAARGA